ncbi:MAG: hypothetical protein KIT33_08690 [Candidatus Kapabacteria bacterium]|nr:hypothetical protein [Ignavibacteriota bacterium]MCW5885032.1 hypothetical protein [Candidatus Kapabacteria bacterium]
MKNIFLILIILLMLMLIIGIYLLIGTKSEQSQSKFITIIDTIYIEVPERNISIEKLSGKYKSFMQNDSSLSFLAAADTVTSSDTITIEYSYPENNFAISLRSRTDSIAVQLLTKELFVIEQKDWWENPLYVLIGFVLGIITGVVI